ncbi:MAG: hypothetical protein HUK16_01465 [Bacteroidales bacterium]|nr:hypothetical protein [Bacteroidales bacterium]
MNAIKTMTTALLIMAASCLFTSCQYDPAYHEEYYVINDLAYPIRMVCNISGTFFNGILDTLEIQPNEEVLIKDWNSDCYGANLELVEVWSVDKGEYIIFNDNLRFCYSDPSTKALEKNFWKKDCWELLYYNGKSRNTHYKLRYHIDDIDQQNALEY